MVTRSIFCHIKFCNAWNTSNVFGDPYHTTDEFHIVL